MNRSGRVHLPDVARSFPHSSTSMLLDTYLNDTPQVSARVFRVYRTTPAHFHRGCDEHLYVLEGRGTFWIENPSTEAEFSPGDLLFFPRGTVHATPRILQEPLVFLAIDTPRRDPDDIVFVDPANGTPADFIQQVSPPPLR